MLILILIDVQYLQNVDFSFEKGLNVQNHSSASYHSLEKSPSKNFPSPNGENCDVRDNLTCKVESDNYFRNGLRSCIY